MRTLRIALTVGIRRRQWLWPATACVLIASAGMHFVLLPENRALLQQLRDETARIEASATAAPAPVNTADANYLLFRSILLASRELPRVTEVLAEEARKRNLTIDHADYRLTTWPDGPFSAYRVSLPIKGNYGEIRSFLLAVLQRLPSAALDSVEIKRETVGTASVEAQVEFVVLCIEGSNP